MKNNRILASMVIALAMLPVSGCFLQKKKPALPPPKAQAPTITVPLASQLPPDAPPAEPPVIPTEPSKPTASKPKSRHRTTAKKTPPPAMNQEAAPSKPTTSAPPVIAKNIPKTIGDAGTNDSSVQISAEVPRNAAVQQKTDTTQLLDSTETNLRKIGGRTLSDGDQATMRQIRNYITQSRLAMQDGDLERAFNLATKANLLCNELIKRL